MEFLQSGPDLLQSLAFGALRQLGFSGPEQERMDEAAKAAADAVRCIILEGADAAMNRYNKKVTQE